MKKKVLKNIIPTKNGPVQLTLVCTNEEKKGTCGSCYYTDNDLGIFALHCTCKKREAKEDTEENENRFFHVYKLKKERVAVFILLTTSVLKNLSSYLRSDCNP